MKKRETTRAFVEDGQLKTHVGGQALIEGIMMRGKYNWSVAVREPYGGIYLEEHDLASGHDKNGWLYWPFIRGCRAFVESLVLGYKALSIAAEHAFAEELDTADNTEAFEVVKDFEDVKNSEVAKKSEEAKGAENIPSELLSHDVHTNYSWKRDFGHPDEMIDALGAQRTLEEIHVSDNEDETETLNEAHDTQPLLGSTELAISMVLGLVLGIALFIVAPAFITNLIVGEYDQKTLLWNIVDGVFRIAVFVFYLWLIGRMKDIKRMFGYHGAEHKTIHCFEHGLPLTPENARSFPRLHVRCGTAFLIMVMIIAIFVYTITPLDGLIAAWGIPDGVPKLAFVIGMRILLMPVIAGIAYEITVKWAGAHPTNPLVKVILWPGMHMQLLTTREPDDGQIECAIMAMQLVLKREERESA